MPHVFNGWKWRIGYWRRMLVGRIGDLEPCANTCRVWVCGLRVSLSVRIASFAKVAFSLLVFLHQFLVFQHHLDAFFRTLWIVVAWCGVRIEAGFAFSVWVAEDLVVSFVEAEVIVWEGSRFFFRIMEFLFDEKCVWWNCRKIGLVLEDLTLTNNWGYNWNLGVCYIIVAVYCT